MNCQIPECKDILDSAISVPSAGLRTWLAGEGKKSLFARATLLAFAYDGVIWGAMMDGVLNIANDVAPEGPSPPLRDETLLEARLFNETAELHIWRDGDNSWQGRVIRPAKADEDETYKEYLDDAQILWGDHAERIGTGFTLMSDGIQGLKHIVPLSFGGDFEERPLRLTVRHYLDPKQDFARITCSRLVNLSKLVEEKGS